MPPWCDPWQTAAQIDILVSDNTSTEGIPSASYRPSNNMAPVRTEQCLTKAFAYITPKHQLNPPPHTHSLSLPPSASSLKKKRVGVDGGCKKKLLVCEVGSYWLTLGLSKICLGFMAKHRVSACPFLCALMLGCAGKDVCCWARKMSDNSSGQVMTWARFYQVTIPPVLRTVYIYLHINYSLLLSNVSSNFCCIYTHPKTKRLSWP